MPSEPLGDISFSGEIVHWAGRDPASLPRSHGSIVAEIHYAARHGSRGWGRVPVEARIGGTGFTTSLFPRDDTYMLPVKVAVQRAGSVGPGDRVAVTMRLASR